MKKHKDKAEKKANYSIHFIHPFSKEALSSSRFTQVNPLTYGQEIRERFKQVSDFELVEIFNQQTLCYGWGSNRATYLSELRQEFLRRGIDISEITNKTGGFNFGESNLAILDGKKVVRVGRRYYWNEYEYDHDNGMEFLPVKPESCASISEWRLRCESAGLVFPKELVQACTELEEKQGLTWPDSFYLLRQHYFVEFLLPNKLLVRPGWARLGKKNSLARASAGERDDESSKS
ncbi:MAG TPA: hypothetical protein PLL62_08575 [Candidatus Saccharicenans sp.]|nr:hypothetical protein [Candidatus Saccharicenans sp.]HQM75274.1 hypothetical protein [Candidatus Saccharicenans sp.]